MGMKTYKNYDKIINDVNASLANNASQLSDAIQYNVKQSLLYDINNVNLAINDIASKMISGDRMLLPHGSYNFTSTLNFINLPEGCKVILDGILNAVGSFSPAIKLSGKNFEFKMNKLRSNIVPVADYSNIVNDGLLLGDIDLFNAQIDINIIDGFLAGIKCAPNNTKGIQYNKINFSYIRNCKTPIQFSVTDGSSWINENTFTGGRLTGYYTIQHINGYSGGYNNNKWYNIGHEVVTSDAITLYNSKNNLFVGNRIAENIGGMYIVEATGCSSNLYIFTLIIPYAMLNINGNHSRYIGILSDVDTSYKWAGFLVDGSVVRFEYCSSSYLNALNQNKTMDVRNTTVQVNTDTASVVLTMPQQFEIEGKEFKIYCNAFTNSITINRYDSSAAIAAGVITSKGCWVIRYALGAWKAYLVPNPLNYQAPSVAADVATIKNDFNTLLSALRTNGIMKPS